MAVKPVFFLVLTISLIMIGIIVAALVIVTQTRTQVLQGHPNSIRLGNSLTPLAYIIKIQPFIGTNFSINGHVNIEFLVKTRTSQIVFHMNDIITLNDTVKVSLSSTGHFVKIVRQEYNHEKQIYIATLSEHLLTGKRYNISLNYLAYMNDRNTGLFRSSYVDANGTKRWLATSQLAATSARQMFPCFDEPQFRTPFTLQVVRKGNMNSLSNSPLKSSISVPHQPGWILDTFEPTPPMSTYLLGIVISDFGNLIAEDNKKFAFKVWAQKENLQYAKYALEIGPKLLAFYEHYFRVPYPLPKIDMVAVPDFPFNGMENWGIIIYRDSAFLYDEKSSSASSKMMTANLIAHEISHQWFGNLVTPVWWNDIWLNEGFATYVQYIGTNSIDFSMMLLDQIITDKVHEALRVDAFKSSHPISQKVDSPNEINALFGDITYKKGSSIIRMMSYFLTEDTFRRGLSKYLKKLSYKNAEQNDLWKQLSLQGYEDGTLSPFLSVKMIMDTWTLQMGYPLVTVRRNKAIGTTILTQERYLLNRTSTLNDTASYKWWIPITYTTASNPRFCSHKPDYWMQPVNTRMIGVDIPTDEKWIIVNLQQSGFYRVNYDKENWLSLASQLQQYHEVIHTINRAQILDDSFSLARSGHLSYDVALEILSYLKLERQYVPIKAAFENLIYVKSLFFNLPHYVALEKFLLTLIIPLYENIGFRDSLNDAFMDQLKRSEIVRWACNLGHHHCIEESKRIFDNLMTNSTNFGDISPNMREIIYCTAIREGNDTYWHHGWSLYKRTNILLEKITLLNALGCSKNTEIIQQFLNMTLDPKSGIRKHNVKAVISAVAKNEWNRELVWQFLQNRWSDIKSHFGTTLFTLTDIVKDVTNYLNTDQHYKEYETFVNENEDNFLSAKLAVQRGRENLKLNIEWMKNQAKDIISWLNWKRYF